MSPLLSQLTFPQIDPIAVAINLSFIGLENPIEIRWYALAYVIGIILGWYTIGRMNQKEPVALSEKAYDNIIVWCIMGVLIGGRLGYVLFYNPSYYLSAPSEIFAVWKGGMSFHGGFLGVVVSFLLMSKYYKLKPLPIFDLACLVAPIGLFFGRIANFINAELYGRTTDVAWGFIFPHSDGLVRHPSQLYEAALEGALLFAILWFLATKKEARKRPGTITGVFLVGYGLSRSFVELFREPDAHIGFLADFITMGQILSLPMIIAGIFFIIKAKPLSDVTITEKRKAS